MTRTKPKTFLSMLLALMLVFTALPMSAFAAETDIDWIGYRLALMVNGEEVPFTSVTYNVTISGLTFE